MITLLQAIGGAVTYTYVMGFLIWITGNRGWSFREFLASPILVPCMMVHSRTWFIRF
jgi:hypothetical protein